jgi:acetyl-CoA C-acetyltransferase
MEIYIASLARTPIGKFGGVFKSISPVDLGAAAIKGAIERAKIDPKEINITIMGNILRAGHGQDLARQAAVKAGIPMEADAYSIDMVCSSGMMSFINAAQMIKCGDANVVVAGGMESMSQSALAVKSEMRWGVKALIGRNLEFIDTMQVDGLTDPFNSKAMGIEADMTAKSNGITRKELDEVAFESQARAAASTASGMFAKEIVPVPYEDKVATADEGIRGDTSMEKLSKLRAAFGTEGLHTAGNASQLSDGAAAMVLMSEKAVRDFGIDPVAKLIGYSWAGVENLKFIEGPVHALKKLSQNTKMDVKSFDYYENNEAFAVSSAVMKKHLGIEYEKLNVYGGAIALGHPIGASGARIIATLTSVLTNKKGNRGIASLCHGTGGGTAVAIEKMKGI